MCRPEVGCMTSPGIAVSLRGLRKQFGDVAAVDGVDLDVYDGEFITLLGPSGSGKTTVLRMIAGFELPTAGTVELDGVDVTRRAPFERDVNTVFQDYALFPHMSVLDNIAYGLRVKKVPRAERLPRAQEALASVALAGYGGRKPSQLSGGQRQRVASPASRFDVPTKPATNGVAGCSYTSAGEPTCSIRPPENTAIRSDMVSASSWSWVTNRKVMPTWRWISLSSTCICSRSFRSSAPSGSSRRSTLGRLTRARARATRWRCPPESCEGFRPPYPASATLASASCARGRRSALGT